MKRCRLGRSFLFFCMIFVFASLNPWDALAWKYAAHWALMDDVARALPPGKIKSAMEAHKVEAAWGANGPDLPFQQASAVVGLNPWADRFHYDRVGSYAKTLLRATLESGDPALIAFAAGWVTHMAGDMAAHGIFVNPDPTVAGVFLDKPETRSDHGNLEIWSERYIFDRYNQQVYGAAGRRLGPAALQALFAFPPPGVADRIQTLVYSTAGRVYAGIGDQPLYKTDVAGWMNFFKRLCLDSGIAGMNIPSSAFQLDDSAGSHLNVNRLLEGGQAPFPPNGNVKDRKGRIEEAWRVGREDSVRLLVAAEKGDYSEFTDRWNMDASNRDGRGIGTIVITLVTAQDSKLFTSPITRDDVVFGLATTKGAEWRSKPLSDTNGDFDRDFIPGSRKDYYLFTNRRDMVPSFLDKLYMERTCVDLIHPVYHPERIIVWIDGQIVHSGIVGKPLTCASSGSNRWETTRLNLYAFPNPAYIGKGEIDMRTEPVRGVILVDGKLAGEGTGVLWIDPGTHTVSFGPVPNFRTPPPRQVTVVEGKKVSATGTYVSKVPKATLVILPVTLDPHSREPFHTVADGLLYTRSPKVFGNFFLPGSKETGAPVAATAMSFSTDKGTWGPWKPYNWFFEEDLSTWKIIAPGTDPGWRDPSVTPLGPNGLKVLLARYKDAAGNISPVYSASMILVKEPPRGSVELNLYSDEPDKTLAYAVLRLDQKYNFNYSVRFSLDGTQWGNWLPFREDWVLPVRGADSLFKQAVYKEFFSPSTTVRTLEYGKKTLFVQFRDAVGNVSPTYSDSVFLSPDAVSGKVLTGGRTRTPSINASLAATGKAGKPIEMQLSTDRTRWTAWEPFASPKTVTVAPGEGRKLVYARFRHKGDPAVPPIYANAVSLDTQPPTGSVVVNNVPDTVMTYIPAGSDFGSNNSDYRGKARYTARTAVPVTFKAEDQGSAVEKMQLSQDGKTWGQWEWFSRTKNVTLTTPDPSGRTGPDRKYNLYVRYQDSSGNESPVYMDSVILDNTPPIVNVLPRLMAVAGNKIFVSLNCSETNTGSAGAVGITFSTKGDKDYGGWLPYAETHEMAVYVDRGSRETSFWYKVIDAAGNENKAWVKLTYPPISY